MSIGCFGLSTLFDGFLYLSMVAYVSVSGHIAFINSLYLSFKSLVLLYLKKRSSTSFNFGKYVGLNATKAS